MSTRSRPQRFSSPHARSGGSARKETTTPSTNGDGERPLTFLDRWIEPPVRSPVPSFEDSGLERHGVVENMQPLGTLPSDKLRKAIVKTQDPKRIKLIHKPVAVPADVASSPEPAPILAASQPTTASRRRLSDDDADYTPKGQQMSGSRKASTRASLHKSGSASTSVSVSHGSTPSPSKIRTNRKRTDRVVRYACEQAVKAGRLPTAYALQTLYDEQRSNDQIVQLIESVYEERTTAAQAQEFLSVMEEKKVEGSRKKKEGMLDMAMIMLPDSNGASNSVRSSRLRRSSHGSASEVLARMRAASRTPTKVSPHKDTAATSPHSHKRRRSSTAGASNQHNALLAALPPSPSPLNGHDLQLSAIPMSRARSESSVSSLSSIDEDILRDDLDDSSLLETHADEDNSAGNTQSTISSDNNVSQEQIAKPSSNPPLSSSTMPAFYSESTPDPFQLPPTNGKANRKGGAAANSQATGDKRPRDNFQEEIDRMKKRARTVTEQSIKVNESRERPLAEVPDSDEDNDEVKSRSITTGTSRRGTGQVLRLRQTRKPNNNNITYDSTGELDDVISPTLLSFHSDVAPHGSTSTSRAGTPNRSNRPTRKAKTGPRTKSSPMKKKSGPLAGIARASGERTSPVGNNSFSNNQDDNDDYCSSCGGSGDLVCCDGCTRSFHFNCVDPPMIEGELPDTWFCNVCMFARFPPAGPARGPFGALMHQLQKKNPSAFALPKDIRDYFEGVKTGADGEYEEAAANKPKTRGWDEMPDYTKTRDAKGNVIVCHHCHMSAESSKLIIPCSFCNLSWHLDCLDPPLANPPPQGRSWKCPCHIDDLLVNVPGSLGPAHRPRKIKGSSAIKPAIARGLRNNGHIEIDNAPSDDEASSAFFERREYGRVYQLPEEGVKLDFIAQLRRKAGRRLCTARSGSTRNTGFASAQTATEISRPAFDRRALDEQQAALNLAQFASHSSVGDDKTQFLIDALMHQASPEMLSLIARADADRLATVPTVVDKTSLLAMKALIDAQLAKIAESADTITSVHDNSAENIENDDTMDHTESVDDRIDLEMPGSTKETSPLPLEAGTDDVAEDRASSVADKVQEPMTPAEAEAENAGVQVATDQADSHEPQGDDSKEVPIEDIEMEL